MSGLTAGSSACSKVTTHNHDDRFAPSIATVISKQIGASRAKPLRGAERALGFEPG
jgi:hypothetical protein